jgi:hypothetical protein
METPNAIGAAAGSGRTAEQAEFEAGANIARSGQDLPDLASDAARRGYDSTETEQTTPAQPGTAREDTEKHLLSHRVAPQAQTDRPEPTTLPSDAEPLNVNDQVSITKDVPGERYLIEGLGASTAIDFKNDVTEESLLAVLIDRLEGPGAEVGDNYAKNAANDCRKALEWLQTRTREKLKRFGVTAGSAGSPLA